MLLKECDRLQKRVHELEDQLDGRFYPPQDNEENDYYEQFFKRNQQPKQKRRLEPEYKPEKPVEIKAVSRRNTSDLYKEAKQKHEEQYETFVDQNAPIEKEDKRPPEEIIGSQRARFYVEQAKALVGGNK